MYTPIEKASHAEICSVSRSRRAARGGPYQPGRTRQALIEDLNHSRQALKGPVLPNAQQSNAGDPLISTFIRNRSTKFQASTALEPTGKVTPKAQAIADFEATRAKALEYVRATQDALREHGAGTPLTSAYQLLLILSGHTESHTAQLLEVKASPGYLKN